MTSQKAPSKAKLVHEAPTSSRPNTTGSSPGSLPCLTSTVADQTTCHWGSTPLFSSPWVFTSFYWMSFLLNSRLINSENHVLDSIIRFFHLYLILEVIYNHESSWSELSKHLQTLVICLCIFINRDVLKSKKCDIIISASTASDSHTCFRNAYW